ncbi:MAG TPA: hypothetical protein VFM01_11140, partial [Nakamurella sp.]|nr:hypothetical protein [Nakamurella sp.]
AAHALGVEATSMLVTGHGSTAQRPAAGSAIAGALRYNTDTARLEVCDGATWQAPTTLTPLPNPVRVYDSRSHDGPIHAGQSRTLSLADRLPAGATGAIVNLTITGTLGGGYLTLYPAGHTRPHTSSINWYTTGQTLANQATTNLGNTTAITIYAAGTTQYLIDLLAYLA